MRVREWLSALGSIALAVVAGQHHTLHMLLIALGVGVGGAGAGFMTMFPTVRRAMLLMSLVMAGATAYSMWRRRGHLRVLGGVSVGLSLVLVGWSIYQFGL